MKKIFPFLLIAGIGASAVAPSFLHKDVVSVSASGGLPDYLDNFTYGEDYLFISNLPFSSRAIHFGLGPPEYRYAMLDYYGVATGSELLALGFGSSTAGMFYTEKAFNYTNLNMDHYVPSGMPSYDRFYFSTLSIYTANETMRMNVDAFSCAVYPNSSVSRYIYGIPYMLNAGNDDYHFDISDNRPRVVNGDLDNYINSWFYFGPQSASYLLSHNYSFRINIIVPNDIYWEGDFSAPLRNAWVGTREVYLAGMTDGAFVANQGGYGQGYNTGYVDGYDDGFYDNNTNAYNDGYNIGKATGEQLGYADGYNDGLDYVTDGSMFSWISAMFVGISGIFNVVIFKDFTIGAIALILIVFTLVPFVIGLFKSGGKR